MLTKLTIANLHSQRGGFPVPTERTYVGRIYGIAKKSVPEQGPHGEYLSFIGNFSGHTPEGEVVDAPACILPAVASAALGSACLNGGDVEFGFDFFILPDETTEQGYVFDAVSLVPLKGAAALAALGAKMPKRPNGATPPKKTSK